MRPPVSLHTLNAPDGIRGGVGVALAEAVRSRLGRRVSAIGDRCEPEPTLNASSGSSSDPPNAPRPIPVWVGKSDTPH